MKKILTVLCTLVLSNGLCFAEDKPAKMGTASMIDDSAKDAMSAVRQAAKVFQGRIQSVKIPDPAQEGTSEITVADSEQSMNFMVSSMTVIYDLHLQPTTLDQIKKNDKVLIKYATNKDKVMEAQTINLLK